MPRYIRGTDRYQSEILPRSLDERIAPENAVRIIDAFVDTLDIQRMGFAHAKPAHTGRDPYDPGDLLKLYIYGYTNRIRSSRRLARECERNIEVMWLLHHLTPDFRTIADFRKVNTKPIKEAFHAFVDIMNEMGLIGKESFCVDGTKMRAVNSIKRSFTPELVEKKLAYNQELMQRIEAYLSGMDGYDEREETLHLDIPREEMPARMEELKERIAKLNGYQQRFAAGEKQILVTDPECRTLHSKDGLYPSYNVQTAVDTRSHVIVDFEITNVNTDANQLSVMAERVKEHLKLGSVHVIADKGYDSREDIEACVMNGIVPDVGLKYDKVERVHTLRYEKADITPAIQASTQPQDIRACLHAGVLPDCYEGTNIRVELQEIGVMSCFLRHEDGTVTCPMGRELFQHRERKHGTVYGSKAACRTCPNRCTTSKSEKAVFVGHHTDCVPVLMYGNSGYELQRIPNGARISPSNHTLDRKKLAQRQVKLTIRRDIAMQQLRKETVEHPFGTIKWYDGAHYFLCKGKEKVGAEMVLSSMGYDLRRAVRLTTGEASKVPGILVFLQGKLDAKRKR